MIVSLARARVRSDQPCPCLDALPFTAGMSPRAGN